MSGVSIQSPLFGLVGCALVLAGLLARAIVREENFSRRVLATGLLFAIALAPLGEASLASRARGLTGDFAATTIVAALILALGRGERTAALGRFALVSAAVLYPMALGVSSFDPYALGYAPTVMPLALLVVGLAAFWRRQASLVTAVGLAQIGFALRLYESDNLWDYVVDPWIALAAAVSALGSSYDFRRRGRRS